MEHSLASVLTETLEAAQAQLDAARQLDPERLADATASRPGPPIRAGDSSRAGMPCKWTPTLRMWSAVSGDRSTVDERVGCGQLRVQECAAAVARRPMVHQGES